MQTYNKQQGNYVFSYQIVCLSWTVTGKRISVNLNYIFLKRDEKIKPHLTFQMLVESKAIEAIGKDKMDLFFLWLIRR
jgi:hypothetical protein